jgi:UDP-2-acetamido-3-amino-2,3-dideoxy-glucuronate N-acetyltransferase
LNLGKIRREENISGLLHRMTFHDFVPGREEPENVFATGGNYLHQKIADVTTTHLEFRRVCGPYFCVLAAPVQRQKLVVVGDRKMAVFDDMQPWKDKLLLYPHEIHCTITFLSLPKPNRSGLRLSRKSRCGWNVNIFLTV